MNEPRSHLPRDLEVLRYLDALNAGDLDAVAALWDHASRDPELEQRLTELDGALFVEHAGTNGKADAKYWAPLPERFGQRQRRGGRRGRRGRSLGGCLLDGRARLARPRWPASGPEPFHHRVGAQAAPRPPNDSASRAAWLEGRRVLDGAEPPPFTWPFEETAPSIRVSTSIPPDLLD